MAELCDITAMFDNVDDADSLQLIKEFVESKKVVGSVCHSTVAFLKAKVSDGSFLIANSEVTGLLELRGRRCRSHRRHAVPIGNGAQQCEWWEVCQGRPGLG